MDAQKIQADNKWREDNVIADRLAVSSEMVSNFLRSKGPGTITIREDLTIQVTNGVRV